MVEKETEPVSAVLGEVFRRRDIHYGFFDLDGTLIDTHHYYDIYMDRYAGVIASLSPGHKEPEYVRETMSNILRGLRSEFSVNPALMLETARITALNFGQDFYSEEIQSHTADLMQLYVNAPAVFDGVHETLGVLMKAGLKPVVATHSEDPWTKVRLAKNGLLSYFEPRIFSFDSFGGKGIEEWKVVYGSLRVGPNQVIVAGDSILNDVDPNLVLGVPPEQIFRIATDYSDANKGELDDEVREVNKFADLPYAILERLY